MPKKGKGKAAQAEHTSAESGDESDVPFSESALTSLKEALVPSLIEALMPKLEDALEKKLIPMLQAEINRQIKPCYEAFEQLKADLNGRIEGVEQSLDHAHARLDNIYSHTVPSIVGHLNSVALALTKRILDTDVHRRKWSLNINGLEGLAGENESITRAKCAELASGKEVIDPNTNERTFDKYLGIRGSSERDFAACHRLKQEADAGIIVRFVDLKRRNEWLENAKNLRGTAMSGVSISPDLPPAIRPFKTELLNIRRQLPPDQKSKASIKYLRQWPYVELRIKDSTEPPRQPSHLAQSTALNTILGGHPLVVNDPNAT